MLDERDLVKKIGEGLPGQIPLVPRPLFCSATLTESLEQATFETAAQMHEELLRTEFDGALCQKFKLLVDRFFLFFSLNVENQ